MKRIGKNLNGTHLNSLLGDADKRTLWKKFLIEKIVSEKQESEEKKECKKEIEHIRKLEADTAEKQEKHAAFRFGVLVIWSLIILIFVFVGYLITTHVMGQLDLDKETTKIFVGLIITLLSFQMAVGTGAIFRGANIKVKDNSGTKK